MKSRRLGFHGKDSSKVEPRFIHYIFVKMEKIVSIILDELNGNQLYPNTFIGHQVHKRAYVFHYVFAHGIDGKIGGLGNGSKSFWVTADL